MHSRFLAFPFVLTFGVAACGGGSQPAPAPAARNRRRPGHR